uniref:BHLH transcription factor n=1 Tax=Dracaena cambodiana TaxID=580341 RepID=A0A7M3UQG6_9ASPA|nr:bHLH transcription factor [Dracaena cambodiana]
MNRGGAFQSPSVHHLLMGGSPVGGGGLWSLDNMRPITHPVLAPSSCSSSSSASSSISTTAANPSASSSSAVLPQYLQPPSSLQQVVLPMVPNWHDNQDQLPESWSQLLLGGLVEEDRSCSFTPFYPKKMENWQEQLMYPSVNARIVDMKQELSDKEYIFCQANEEIQAPRSSWNQILPNSSPRSCITTSFNSSMLDFSNSKADTRQYHQLDHSSQECNSTPTGSPYKKARIQASSAQSSFKVRKEKLGDRITALHQLVSPFGKTDTASVLLEAIGYIRFLQSQIEALSSPYLATGTAANMKMKQHQPPVAHGDQTSCIFPEDPGQLLNDSCMKRRGVSEQDCSDHETKKDLRSRGLCLVPVSFTLHVGSDNGADYWAPTFGGGFDKGGAGDMACFASKGGYNITSSHPDEKRFLVG